MALNVAKFSFGSVKKDGSPRPGGSGDWTSTKRSKGVYEIKFNPPLPSDPAISVTLYNDTNNFVSLHEEVGASLKEGFLAKTLNHLRVDNTNKDSALMDGAVPDQNGNERGLDDSEFSFVAMYIV